MQRLILFFHLLTITCAAQAQTIQVMDQGKPCSLRGLSVVNNNIAWVSGSKGHVAISVNGGRTWQWQQVKGFEQSDFRDVEAFSDKEAIIIASGTPALILKTTDGGLNWQVVYRNDDKAYFLDGMDFFNQQHGVVMGDPVNGKFLLLETNDKGRTWAPVKDAPDALPGEAAFAASGTSIRAINKQGEMMLVTGGSVSRIIVGDKLKNWSAKSLPLAQGISSKGAFSVAVNGQRMVVTGGNYEQNRNTDSVACYNDIKGEAATFKLSQHPPAGYQSCVEYLGSNTFLSTGTSGTNITADGGQTWKQIGTASFNVCQKAKHGSLVILAGDSGKIAIFKNQ